MRSIVRVSVAGVLVSAVACTPSPGSISIDAPRGDGSGSNSVGAVTLELSGSGEYDVFATSGAGSGQVTCTAALAVTGTFVSAGSVVLNGGCQPDGTWTVTAALAGSDNGCGTPAFANPYVYTVSAVPAPGRGTMITYMGSDASENFKISGDDDACTGSFDHDDANYAIALRPVTPNF